MAWLTQLAPDPGRPAPEPVSDPELVDAVISAVGEGAVAWAAQVGADAEVAITDRVPIFADEPDLRIGPESATLGALLKFSGAPDVPALPQDGARAISHYIVSGASLDQLLSGIRIGHSTMSEAFLSACERLSPPEATAAALRATSTLLFEYIDAFAAAAADKYRVEHERYFASPAATRLRAVREFLAEGNDVLDTAAASKALDYPLDQTHIAVIFDSGQGGEPANLKRLAFRTARQIFAPAYLIVEAEQQVWSWFVSPANGLPQVLERIELPRGVAASVGEPADGPDGFRQTHHQARSVRDARSTCAGAPALWDYCAADLVLTFAADLAAARSFVSRHLHGLNGRTATEEDIRKTLLAYFDAHSSPLAVAQQLHLARNTVSARVQRAGALLGRDLTQPTLDVHLALKLVAVIGDAVLPDGDGADS